MSQFFRQSLWLYAIIFIGFTLSLLTFSPGYMEYDSFDQYGQAIGKLPLDDWHPVSMTLLWRLLIYVKEGPQLMLLLQMGGYWSGFLYLAWHLLKNTSRLSLAIVAAIVPFFPFVINFSGVIWKDTHLAISLFWATLLLCFGKSSRYPLILSLVLIFYAISVRHNAFAAALPIVVLWSDQYLRSSRFKNLLNLPVVTLLVIVAYLLLNLGFSHFIAFEKTSPLNAQLLNEIFFIKCQSHDSSFDSLQPYFGDQSLAIKSPYRQHYICDRIDSLATTEDTNEIYDQKIIQEPDSQDHQIKALWGRTVSQHPFLYLKYRWIVYRTFLRPWRYPEPYYTFVDGLDDENFLPFKLSFQAFNLGGSAEILREYITLSSQYLQLFFRPFFWLLTLTITLIWSARQKATDAFLIALSGFLYLILYFFFLPAPDFRYCYYSIFAQILAIFMLINRIFSQKENQLK
jgi:hypothetical protein